MNLTRLAHATLVALTFALLGATNASAAPRLEITGAGFGHGIGMSQYGAYGMALEGYDYSQILSHYYTGTRLDAINPNKTVRVLLKTTSGTTVSGASAAGDRALNPRATYTLRSRGGNSIELLSPRKKRLALFADAVQVVGPGPLVTGDRAYRGALEFRPAGGSLNTINAVNIEDYIRGVVALESPASWPLEALKAQAVAARTYALTTSKGGNGFEQYADTRSQVYGGVAAERPTTDAAVRATSGHVVTYNGAPVVTYFFSTSGGQTEHVENVWSGAHASPWLRSVTDPYDRVSPVHRWQRVTLSMGEAKRRLAGLVHGRLREIRVTRRGVSPRILSAEIVGSRGRTTVSGATLRLRLGLRDTWAYFETVGAKKKKPARR